MTEENKTETKAETKKEEKQEVARGNRGELGVATAALTIKQEWHEAHFRLVDVGTRSNPQKKAWVKNSGAPSLKRFARERAASGNKVAKEWLNNKLGARNEERSDKNKTRISLEKQASKAARRKKGQGKQTKPAADAAGGK